MPCYVVSFLTKLQSEIKKRIKYTGNNIHYIAILYIILPNLCVDEGIQPGDSNVHLRL